MLGRLFAGAGKMLKNPSNAFFGGLMAGDWINLDIKPDKDSPLYKGEQQQQGQSMNNMPSWLLPVGLGVLVLMVVKK